MEWTEAAQSSDCNSFPRTAEARGVALALQDSLHERRGRDAVHILLGRERAERGVEGEAAGLEALGAEVVVGRGELRQSHLQDMAGEVSETGGETARAGEGDGARQERGRLFGGMAARLLVVDDLDALQLTLLGRCAWGQS